ncbi:TonB-dependent receptor family protein [Echinicola shivajiensis]|uniref:TonB-dependent receptor family protein n=1 Tax=Echinicola shivajiensis TaxID=1035916 RepID=UPI001BFC760B|nr:TonB-dependent receptor [Echinicola shivajiensis]
MKLKLTIPFAIFVGLLPNLLLGQTVLTILDAENQEPIPAVLVKINSQNKEISDEQGQVMLDIQKTENVSFSHISYDGLWVKIQPNENKTILLQRKTNSLSEVVVSTFGSSRPLIEQSAAVSQIGEQEFYRFNETSLVSVFNTKSGIRLEERAPGSYRVSIRGSSLRAPFGVRNVKVYWNGIPFTSPDGTTALNLLDLNNVQGAEIIKGPAGSIYGAGNGGVISFNSKPIDENNLQMNLGLGEYGLVKYSLAVQQKMEKANIHANFVQQKSDGYRDHSAFDRKVLQLGANFFPSEKQSVSTQLLYSDLFYQIPGGLNADQVAENPQQARPGSAAQNASISQKTLYGTFVHDYDFNDQWNNHTSAYIQTTDFENPFNLDYKKETQYGYGGRTKFSLNDQWASFPVKVIFGGEYQFSNTSAQNFGNRGGQADTIRFSDDLITTQAFLFQQLEINWTEAVRMTLGLSENFSKFDINRTIDASTGEPYAVERTFDPVWVPRLALSGKLNDYSSVFGSISSGFSPPTIDEVRTNEGTINLDLEAEKGVNYEIGYRASYWDNRFDIDISTFYFKLDETITTYTNEQGVVLFQNAGATDQKGLEAQLDYIVFRNPLSWLQELNLIHAYSFYHFRFKDYVDDGEVYSGNKLTGVAPNNLVNQINLKTRAGLYLNITHQFVDKIPLDDANTVFQDAYNLLGARMGWRQSLGALFDLELYFGAENILDEQYSLGNDLNAFGGRYYQPAAPLNFYGGIKLKVNY